MCAGDPMTEVPASQLPRFTLPEQHVSLQTLPVEGWILDMGGGGEGIIGQLMGAQVVAIDLSERELRDAAPGPLKLVMDARELKFLENSFSAVTCFFSLMYVPPQDKPAIFRELFRVLKPGGSCWVWEVTIPHEAEPPKDIFVIPLQVTLPGERIVQTGYGVRWASRWHTAADLIQAAEAAGFTTLETQPNDHTFKLHFVKSSKE